MASFLDSAAVAIAHAANWKPPKADGQGVYEFSLRDGLDMRLFSPDGGNTVILWSTVQTLPDDVREREELLLAQAQRSVASCRERGTTLALEGDALIIQRVLHPRQNTLEDIPGIAEDFLNDLTWWRAQAARLAR